MFTFEPYDDSNIQGRAKDDLPEDLKNEFHFSVHCEGLKELDDMIFVRVSENVIQFFCESEEVSEAKKDRVVESISLTNPKDTGYDLLYFAEKVGRKSLIKKELVDDEQVRCKLDEFLQRGEKIFKGFPFFDDHTKRCRRLGRYNYDRVFLRLCLLEFLLAVDTHDEIFAIAPRFDEMRNKLRASKVYCLLCAKLRYCMYCYEGREALNEEEYSFVVSKFADLLMDADYNKMVPPSYYDEPRFLFNPELEMCHIIHRKDSKNLVRDATQEKIRSFFLTKHATLECDFGTWHRWVKLARFVLMLVMAVWMVLSMMWFDFPEKGNVVLTFFLRRYSHAYAVQEHGILSFLTKLTNAFFDTNWFVYLLGVWLALSLLILIFPFTKGVYPRRRVGGKVFHSRIVVALLMGWFAIAVSDDLVKSQLELNRTMVWWALIVVLGIVGMMLWGEVRLHSPYYCRLKLRKITSWPKVSVVLVYAMFWNLIMGIVMQSIMYLPLLETSGTMPVAILGQMPDEVDKYRNKVETCIGMLDDFDRTMDGIIHDRGKIAARDIVKEDILRKDDDSMVMKTTIKPNIKQTNEPEDIYRSIVIHDNYLENMSLWIKHIEENSLVEFSYDSVQKAMLIRKDSLYFLIDSAMRVSYYEKKDASFVGLDPVFEEFAEWSKNCAFPDSLKYNDSVVRSFINENLAKARGFKSDLRLQLVSIDYFIQKNLNPDELRHYALFVNDTVVLNKVVVPGAKNYYLAYLGYDASLHHKFCRKFMIKDSKGKQVINPTIFPRMLIFHSLIVFLIAFVGQLIISDKSVTEPL